MRSVDRKSPVSTVTSLFMDDGVLGAEEVGNHRNSRPSSYKIRYNDKIYSSASKVLEKYIHHFEEEQTWELAKSLTENCTQTPIKREVRRAKLKSAPSTIEKEIRLARQLLPSSYTDDTCGSDSVDTDDLLTSRSNFETVTTIPFKDQPNYRRNFNPFRKKRFYQPFIHIRDNADYDMTESAYSDSESTTTSLWETESTYPSIHPSYNRKRNTRKVLEFSSADETSDMTSNCSTPRNYDVTGNTVSSEDYSDAQPKSQLEDLQRTLRLVDDLKADLAATESTLGGVVDRNSLSDLILRLSVAAKRKEDKLRESMRKSMKHEDSLHYSHLDSSSMNRNGRRSCLKSSSFGPNLQNPGVRTPTHRDVSRGCTSAPATPVKRFEHRVYDEHRNVRAGLSVSTNLSNKDAPNSTKQNTTMLTSDNISEAMRLIDGRRMLDISSNTLQSESEMSSACDVVLSNPTKRIQSTNQNLDWEHLLNTNPQVETLLNKAASHREPHVTTPTNSISTMHAGRTPYIHHSVTPSGSPTTTDEILDADRTWERMPPARKSDSDSSSHISVSFCMEGKPLAVKDFMEECLLSSKSENTSLSGGKQPGSVEALKNMIFTLQSMTSQGGAGDNNAGHEEEGGTLNGQKSLERALVHLTNLKNIVQK